MKTDHQSTKVGGHMHNYYRRILIHNPFPPNRPLERTMGPSTATRHWQFIYCDIQSGIEVQVGGVLQADSLRQHANKSTEVIRSRDPKVLDTCDIVVDVGAIYDEGKQRFDHHQRGFEEVFGHGFKTKLSSAGLVYK
jgi:hypothetical protein